MILWKVCLMYTYIETPLTESNYKTDVILQIWVELYVKDDTVRLRAALYTVLMSKAAPHIKVVLNEVLSQNEILLINTKMGGSASTYLLTCNPWTLKENLLKAPWGVHQVRHIPLLNRNWMSEGDLAEEVMFVRAHMTHYVMAARALCMDTTQSLPTLISLNYPGRIIKAMSLCPAWLNDLNAALQSPVRCDWENHAP